MNTILAEVEVNALPALDVEAYEPTDLDLAEYAAMLADDDERAMAEWQMELELRAEACLALDRMCDAPAGSFIGHDDSTY